MYENKIRKLVEIVLRSGAGRTMEGVSLIKIY
jgi:hypothetical protein